MMNTLLLTVALGAPPATQPPPPTPLLAVQDDEEEIKKRPDKRAEVKELVETLDDHAGARGKEDQEAIAVVDLLLGEFKVSGPKDRASIVKEIASCLKEKRKEIEGEPDNKLYIACAVALGEMGPESVKPLQSWIGHKQHRRDLILQATLIRSLGKTRDLKASKTLMDLLTHKDAEVQAAAAEALGNYVEVKQDLRKKIFEAILKELTSTYNAANSDVNNTIARERRDQISAPMITTLQALSGHDERDPNKWQRWWNKNKRSNWDEEE